MFLQIKSILEIWNNPKKSADEIRSLQNKKLKKLIWYSYKWVPFYRRLFDKHGISPSDISHVEDLEHLPLLDKLTIKMEAEQLLSTQYAQNKLIRQTTGGSTGIPLAVYRSNRSAALDKAAKLRTYFQNGYKPYFKIAVAQHLEPKQKFFHKFGIHREFAVPYRATIENQVKQIALSKAEVIDAQPNRIELISRYLVSRSISLDHVQIIFTHSEKLTDSQRSLVRNAFGVNPIDCYGCTESAAIAAECERHQGYHVNSDLVILESLPLNGRNSDNSLQRIVLTNLNNFAMPLIRYEVGDLAIPSTQQCSCGSNFPLLAEIAGRTNDLMTLPSGEKISGFVLARSIEENDDVLQYRATQSRSGDIDIDLILVAGAKSPETSLLKRFSSDFPGVKVTFHYPEKIPLSPRGKLCRFESEYGN